MRHDEACRVTVVEITRRRALRGALSCAALLATVPASAAVLSPLRPGDVEPVDGALRRPLGDLSLPGLDGRDGRVRERPARLVLLHVFASWCEPCRTELPRLADYVAEHADVSLYAVALAEPPERVRRFLAGLGLDIPVQIDADRSASRRLGVSELPTTFLLDSDFVPRFVVRGDLDWSLPDVRRWLADPA